MYRSLLIVETSLLEHSMASTGQVVRADRQSTQTGFDRLVHLLDGHLSKQRDLDLEELNNCVEAFPNPTMPHHGHVHFCQGRPFLVDSALQTPYRSAMRHEQIAEKEMDPSRQCFAIIHRSIARAERGVEPALCFILCRSPLHIQKSRLGSQ